MKELQTKIDTNSAIVRLHESLSFEVAESLIQREIISTITLVLSKLISKNNAPQNAKIRVDVKTAHMFENAVEIDMTVYQLKVKNLKKDEKFHARVDVYNAFTKSFVYQTAEVTFATMPKIANCLVNAVFACYAKNPCPSIEMTIKF